MPRPSVAWRYARFVLGLALDHVPQPVAAKAASLALDTLGSCLASSREDFGNAALVVPADQSALVVRIVGDLAAQAHLTELMDSLTA